MTEMIDYGEQFEEVNRSLDSAAHQLERQNEAIAAVLAQANTLHRSLQSHLREIAKGQDGLDKKVLQLSTDLAAFAARSHRHLERLTAQVGLVDLRAEIQRKYGPYEDVRRTMRGILDVWESGLAHDATLQYIAEKKGIDAPGYWLASVLNATVSWVRKDQVTMESALLKAMSSHVSKTALFAGLLNARYRRFDATDSWLRLYLPSQDPLQLADEFVVVLDSAMLGVLGSAARDQINVKCMTWFDQLSSRAELVAAQVDRWEKFIARHSPRGARSEEDFSRSYHGLTQINAGWRQIARELYQAKAFGNAKHILRPLDAEEKADPDERLNGIDRVLRRLSELPEPGERELRSKEFDLKRMADPDGDEETLADLLKTEATLNEPTTGFFDLITNLVMHPERFDVSPRTRQLATHLARDWICEATINLRARSEAAVPETMSATIDNWQGDIGSRIEPNEVADQLARRMDQNTEYELTMERRNIPRIFFSTVAFASLALWLVAVTSGAFLAFQALVLLAVFVVCGVVALGIHLNTPRRMAAIRAQGKRRKADAMDTLHAAVGAHAGLMRQWKELIVEADDLLESVRAVQLPVVVEDNAEISSWLDDERPGTVARSQSQAPAILPRWDLKPAGW
ncbi:hypothetical protein HH310_19795 [Actinoplanes sp. TBRC 11911]|uniref:hypothetical protein n=1 Tax=Actinoplanes sp. TBRC 11911 TaxID=2729386 RepID=UPI00145CDF84|nr:hypothetical protein [Actinoplanes sp. TBRC 11911]NMO53420.1 hypothetical protein [Actinoplanes sp. TBRC 11911]